MSTTNRKLFCFGGVSRPPRKRGCRRLGAYVCLALFVFLAVGCAAFAYLVSDPGNHSPWRSIPAGALAVVDIAAPDSILERLEQDGGIDALLASMSDADAANLERLRSFSPSLRKNGVLAAMMPRPERIMAVFYESTSPVFLFALPKIAGMCLSIVGRFKTAFRVSDHETWHFFTRDGWLAASASKYALDDVRNSWNGPGDVFGQGPQTKKTYAAMAWRRANDMTAQTPQPGFLAADPFASTAENDAESSGRGEMAWLLAEPESATWSLGGGYKSEALSGDHPDFESATAECPAFIDADADAPGHITLMADANPAMLAKLDWVRSQHAPAVDHPWSALGRLWLRDGWLTHADGRFFLDIAAHSEAHFPEMHLLWSIPKDDSLAPRDFSSALNLWLQSLSAPGGSPISQSLRSTLDYVEFAEEDGRGGVLTAPESLAAGLHFEWMMRNRPERAEGVMTLSAKTTTTSGKASFPAWPESLSETGRTRRVLRQPPGQSGDGPADEMLTLSADWRMSAALVRKGGIAWKMLRTMISSQQSRNAMQRWSDRLRPCLSSYPAGSLSLRHDGGDLVFRAILRTG